MIKKITERSLSSNIRTHALLIPGDICVRVSDTDCKNPLIIRYSYASEYGISDFHLKELFQYSAYYQLPDGKWSRISWIDRTDLKYLGHIGHGKLYTISILEKLGVKTSKFKINVDEINLETNPDYLSYGDLCLYHAFKGTEYEKDYKVYIVGSYALLFDSLSSEEDYNIYKVYYKGDGATEAWIHREDLTFVAHCPAELTNLIHTRNIKK